MLHGCSLFDHQAFFLNPGDEGFAGLKAERLSNGSRNHQPSLSAQPNIGMKFSV